MQVQDEPLRVLLDLYSSRPDLQEAYPEVSDNELQPLINWAASAVSGALQDSHRHLLQPYASWYAEHTRAFKPPILWEAVKETCGLAKNTHAATTLPGSMVAEADD